MRSLMGMDILLVIIDEGEINKIVFTEQKTHNFSSLTFCITQWWSAGK